MKLKLPINQKTLKSAAKVGAFVGAGAIGAQVGSEIAKRGISAVRDFAAQGEMNEAIVDAVAGVAAAGVGLVIYAKVKSPAAAQGIAPFVIGGALISAAAPVVVPRIMGYVESAVSNMLPAPGGNYRELMPGGYSGFDLPSPGGESGFDIPMPGGASSFDLPMSGRRY